MDCAGLLQFKIDANLSTGCIGWRRYTPCSVLLAICNSIRCGHELDDIVIRDDNVIMVIIAYNMVCVDMGKASIWLRRWADR